MLHHLSFKALNSYFIYHNVSLLFESVHEKTNKLGSDQV